MSSLVKAAVISAVVFIALIGGAFFLIKKDKRGPVVNEAPVEVETPKQKPAEPPAPPKGTPIARPISRDAVKVAVEVVEKGRKRKLQGSRVLILKATDGDRVLMKSSAWFRLPDRLKKMT